MRNNGRYSRSKEGIFGKVFNAKAMEKAESSLGEMSKNYEKSKERASLKQYLQVLSQEIQRDVSKVKEYIKLLETKGGNEFTFSDLMNTQKLLLRMNFLNPSDFMFFLLKK